MITILTDPSAPISQLDYNNVIIHLNIYNLQCSCGNSGCLSVHGYYHRSFRTSGGKLLLRICRVRCKVCRVTHALLLSSMVPYSQIQVKNQRDILSEYLSRRSYSSILQSNLYLTESDIRHVIRSFVNYRNMTLKKVFVALLELLISDTSLYSLIQLCFNHIQRQFMQMKKGINVLYVPL